MYLLLFEVTDAFRLGDLHMLDLHLILYPLLVLDGPPENLSQPKDGLLLDLFSVNVEILQLGIELLSTAMGVLQLG
jgi:hypothetical protein